MKEEALNDRNQSLEFDPCRSRKCKPGKSGLSFCFRWYSTPCNFKAGAQKTVPILQAPVVP